MSLIYQYPPLIPGRLIKRYKRFLADIELDTGEIITAHCPNTGPMTGVYIPDSLVWVSKSDNPKRKLAYTWEMTQIDSTWVGTNTAIPNRVVKLALEQKLFPELANRYNKVRSEVPYGKDKKSRVDFLLSGDDDREQIYLEVKSVTLSKGNLALFPDTVTTRGQKHLQELTDLVPDTKAVMLYFINRGDCDRFAPSDSCDRLYGELLRKGVSKGLEVLPYRFEITPEGISYLGMAEFLQSEP
ncbi:DNA/RNA nuclease SfsA [Waterburya agarophytonicola K14]|uniref:Sugar fermentation stimulation protein homolog n=1 Tax=Waterburya agarophytonicola KI4 TaxID=2874699 RepID=A0A964BSM0_9CYAN|nr:DNA/RNA nuclease SfsA [Waterburya agarophytonicola]MCC0178984.1 DNA/RNA nuclease SfsA [Waterburya agarophytonicola KI4]